MKSAYFFIVSFLFSCCHFLQAQNPQENWVLDSSETGNKTYIARDSIVLKPGFTYTATQGNTFTAKIDRTLLFPPTDNTYLKPDGTITADPAQGAVVGNLSGVFDVSPTGAATYTVPIEVPPGIQGMQPNISLVYNSQSGNGIVGMCWNIGGLSMISRVPKDYYFDDERSGIIWDTISPLALDGQRLIKIQRWGTDSIEYRTESGLDRIVGYYINVFGPNIFKVYTKEGKTLTYGTKDYYYSDQTLEYHYPIKVLYYPNLGVYSYNNLGWLLYEVRDNNNNYVKYNYTNTNWKTENSNYYYFGDNRVSEIEYGNGSTKVANVNFQYKNRSSSFIQYVDSIDTKNQLILDKIEIKGMNDEIQTTYQLAYDSIDTNYYLNSIKKITDSDEYFHPLKFSWSPISYAHEYKDISFDSIPNILTSFAQTKSFRPYSYGDIDGDGLTDILVRYSLKTGSPQNYWAVYRNNGNGNFKYMNQFEWDKENENSFLFLDMDFDGKDELYVSRVKQEGSGSNTTYWFYMNCYKILTNGKFDAYPSGDIKISTGKDVYDNRNGLFVVPGNFTGKGNIQFIVYLKNNQPKFYSGFVISPLERSVPGDGTSGSKIILSDIRGNGKTGITYIKNGTAYFYEYQEHGEVYNGQSYLGGYTGFGVLFTKDNMFKNNDFILTGDFNGDGKTDFLVKYKSNTPCWKLWTSTGTDFIEKTISPNDISYDVNKESIIVIDVNKDGKSDIVLRASNFVNGSASTATLKILISTGDGFITKILDATGPLLSSTNYEMASKMQTTHAQDILLNDNPAVSSSNIVKICSISKNIWFNKITKIENSLGEELNISYMENRNPYPVQQKTFTETENSVETDKIVNNILPQLEVVGNITATNLNQSYEYKGTQIDRQSKGFLGFTTINEIDSIRLITTVAENKFNGTYNFLYPYKNTVKTTGGTLLNESYQTYTPTAIYDDNKTKRYFLKQDSLVSTDALKGVTVKTAYSNYDTDRNPQTINTNYGSDFTTTQALTYASRGSLFQNKIASQQTTQKATGQPDVVRKTYYFYDNKGNITQQTVDSTDVNKVQTFYSNYDQYGNPQKITTTANGISRSKSMTYCSSGRFLKTETDNQFNETTTYNYDESRGLLLNKIDRIGTTSYQYDNFGRLKWTTFPDGIKSVNVLQWTYEKMYGKPDGAKYYNYSETSGQSPVWVWYDGLGREIRRDSYGLNNKKIMIDTEYNIEGQVYRVSDPYFGAFSSIFPGEGIILRSDGNDKTYSVTNTYDSYGRISKTVTPMGTTTYAYSGLTTTVTSPTNTRKTTINPAGQTIEEETNGKKVNFTYYASGLMKTATPEGGAAITMEYDLQGNRTKLTDPDAGVITSNYDGWGQLTQEEQKIHVDANPILTTYDYLLSGLVNYQLRNGEKTNYGYDNLCRLKWVSIAGKHSQGFIYDQYDRIVQSNDTVDGNRVYIQKTDFDLLGNVYKETYPSGYSITNQYDKYGYLTGVTDGNGSNIWQALESNAKGQLTKYSQGSDTTSVEIDSRGFPTSIICPNIINSSYNFSSKGNLDYRQDNLTGYKETFNYDVTNRLVNWSIYKNNVIQKSDNVTFNATTGNIATKSDIGDFAMNYEEGNNKPHALTSISGVPAGFPADNLTVTYTDFKKIKTLTEGAKTYTLSYGVDEQRIKSVYAENGIPQLTRYYMGDYEEEISSAGSLRMIHYLGNGAIYVTNNGKDSLLFTYTDYLGSPIALTDYSGNVLEKYAFDPWGNRRNPGDWTQKDARTSWRFNRGYTGHEQLDAFGIINMNGRVYDPLTAQFFSPDPYLQAPEDWLNYNRYSYCLNNPMLYTDQSGEFLGLFCRALIFVGDALSNWINGYSDPIGNAWKTSGDLTSRISSCLQIPILNNSNTLITAGLDPLGLGISANVSHKSGNLTTSSSFGFGLLDGPFASADASYSAGKWNFGAGVGAGNNYWGWNASVITPKGGGVGYGRTYYGGDIGPDGQSNAQTVGSLTAYWKGGSFTLQNDVKFLGDGHDRWRTNAFELTIGDFSFGGSIYTNDPETEGLGVDELPGRPDLLGNYNKHGKSSWKNGQVYRSPLYIGTRIGNTVSRVGFSTPIFQDRTQNWVHRNGFFYLPFGYQNFYVNYDFFRSGIYLYGGRYQPYSLWGY